MDPRGTADDIVGSLLRHLNACIAECRARYQPWLSLPIDLHPQDALASFRSLLTAVRQTPHRLYLLIDEYDNFANEVIVSQERGTARHQELIGAEGVLKTLCKAVKAAAGGQGLERVHGPVLRHHTQAVVRLGMRLVWMN